MVIVIATAGLTRLCDTEYWFEIKTAKEYFDNRFQDEFSSMLNMFSYRWETAEDKMRVVSDITAHSYFGMRVFHQTSYSGNPDLNDVVVVMYNLSSAGRVFEAVDEETVSDLRELSHDLDNRELAQKIRNKICEYY